LILIRFVESENSSFMNGGKCELYTTVIVMFGLWKIFGNRQILSQFFIVAQLIRDVKFLAAGNSPHAEILWVNHST
jgi:hypothetical protein